MGQLGIEQEVSENKSTMEGHVSSLNLVKVKNEVAQSCLTLCDPMDCSLLGSSIHGIFQARAKQALGKAALGALFA